MRDPFDEQWSPTDENGHFVVYPTDDSYLLAILHPSGFAIQSGAAKNVVFRLEPWATITFRSTGDVADQEANISIKPIGTKAGAPGFQIYSVKTKGKPVEVKVPAGAIVLSRSLAMGQGTSISLPVDEFPLKPGETRAFELQPPRGADPESGPKTCTSNCTAAVATTIRSRERSPLLISAGNCIK